jgi:DNA polymerase-3 subunit epsilon
MSRIICGLDLETTGFVYEKGHRVIEVCLSLYDEATKRQIYNFTQRINPGRSIPPDSTAVHGITEADLVGAPNMVSVAPKIQRILGKSQLLVIHNASFDVPFIASELEACELEIPSHLDVCCTMEGARWATADGKSPKLAELCYALSVEYDVTKAHSADYDVNVMMECWFKGRELGFFN